MKLVINNHSNNIKITFLILIINNDRRGKCYPTAKIEPVQEGTNQNCLCVQHNTRISLTVNPKDINPFSA